VVEELGAECPGNLGMGSRALAVEWPGLPNVQELRVGLVSALETRLVAAVVAHSLTKKQCVS
jgi:hypothetical protein